MCHSFHFEPLHEKKKEKKNFYPNQNISFLIRQIKANKMGTVLFFSRSGSKGLNGLQIHTSK